MGEVHVISVVGNGCEVTPATRYLTKNESTTFELVGSGCLTPFNAVVINGDADIVQDGNKFTITASKVDEIVKIKFSDSAKNEVISEMEVVGKFTCSTQNIYLENLEDDRSFSVSPYTPSAIVGEVKMSDNKVIFTPPKVYVNATITVNSADGQECSVHIYEATLPPVISPSFAKLELSDIKKFIASLGTGEYSWSVDVGSVEELSDNTILYTAPKYTITDILTVTDNSGQEATATIQVCEDIANCDDEPTPEIKLIKGWNLVSIPVDIKFTKIAEGSVPQFGMRDIKELGSYKTLWTFEDNNWSNPTTIKPKTGFWINSLENEKSIYFNENSYQINVNNLSKGWYLLGSGEKLENLHTNSNIEIVYTYSANLGQWNKNPNIINLGEGFWVKK